MSTSNGTTNVGNSLIPIKGISSKMRDLLHGLNIRNVSALRAAGMDAAARESLKANIRQKQSQVKDRQKVGIQLINMWIRQIDLWRVPGMTADWAWLIAQAGVRSVEDLAKCDVSKLYNMVCVVSQSQFEEYACPDVENLEYLITGAETLVPKTTIVTNLGNLNVNGASLPYQLRRALNTLGYNRIKPSSKGDNAADCLTNLTSEELIVAYKLSGLQRPKDIDAELKALKVAAEAHVDDRNWTVRHIENTTSLDMQDQAEPTHLFAETKEKEEVIEVVGTYETIVAGLRSLDLSDTDGLPQVIRGKVAVRQESSMQPAVGVLVQVTGFLTSVNDLSQIQRPVQTYTNKYGQFDILMPEKYNLCAVLTFTFSNSEGQQQITKTASEILSHVSTVTEGKDAGTVLCDLTQDTVFYLDDGKFSAAIEEPKTLPSVRLQGEEGENPVYLNPDTAPVRTFSYSLLQRLTVPGSTRERQQISDPIDVYQFKVNLRAKHDDIVMSSGLSIGYILGMTQAWMPDGYALGDLLYSLVLAPGEEQRIVVREHTEEYSVGDQTSGTDVVNDTTQQTQQDQIDEIFSQASRQTGWASQSSNYEASAKSSSFSGSAILVAGSTSSSKNSGSSGASAATSNTYSDASQAAERFQTTIASASSRIAQTNRVAIRTATSSESEAVSTKLIANHNHSHVMTVQYWEVVRRYKLQTCIDNVKLVLFVPLKLIPFYNGKYGETDYYTFSSYVITPRTFRDRYEGLMQHADVLDACLPRSYKNAFKLCREIYNTKGWAEESTTTERTFRLVIEGNFLKEDNVSAYLRTNKGQIIYPTPSVSKADTSIERYGMSFESKAALQTYIANLRNGVKSTQMTFGFTIPKNAAMDTSFSLVIERNCEAITVYPFSKDKFDEIMQVIVENQTEKYWHFSKDDDSSKGDLKRIEHYSEARDMMLDTGLSLSESQMIAAGTLRISVSLDLGEKETDKGEKETDKGKKETEKNDTLYITNAGATLGRSMRMTLNRSGQVYYSRDDLSRVEDLYQHVLNNTYDYSRFVWENMSDGERVLMLEGYTISMDTDQDGEMSKTNFPLLNCVDALSPIGFYGNSIILPFYIPDDYSLQKAMLNEIKDGKSSVGDTSFDDITEENFSSRTLQDRIYKHHSTDFRVPTTVVSVPTKGMIGEAVLGETNVSELIDITRFWNWKDSDIDHMSLDTSALGGNSLLANATAPTVTMPTQGAILPQHIQANEILSSLSKNPQFADVLSKIDMRDVLSNADNNASTGRETAINATSNMVNESIKQAANVATAYLTGSAATQQAEINKEKEVEVAKITGTKQSDKSAAGADKGGASAGGTGNSAAGGGAAGGSQSGTCKCNTCGNYKSAKADASASEQK